MHGFYFRRMGRSKHIFVILVPSLLIILFCAPLGWGVRAQQQAAGPSVSISRVESKKVLKTQTDITRVNVNVTDARGRPVTGLDQENFRVFENGVEQEITSFFSEDAPLSIGVIFDMSGSMANKIEKSRLAVVQFFRTANPQDEFFLVDFNDRAELVSEFTPSVEALQDRLLYTAAHGSTALLDAVYLGLTEMKQAQHSRRALLIISDGGDNHSRYSENDIKKFAREADVEICAIGLFEQDGGPTQEEREGPVLLQSLTDLTGGLVFTVQDLNELADVATKISLALRNQYVVGYKPANRENDRKWRKIKVKLRPPKGLPPLSVAAKNGYFPAGN